jgi:hypothetical protein
MPCFERQFPQGMVVNWLQEIDHRSLRCLCAAAFGIAAPFREQGVRKKLRQRFRRLALRSPKGQAFRAKRKTEGNEPPS